MQVDAKQEVGERTKNVEDNKYLLDRVFIAVSTP